MLVPLVDMLNHAGDVTISNPGATQPTVRADDNVRWELRALGPASGGSSGSTGAAGGAPEWVMEVSTTREVAAGEELLLSYGQLVSMSLASASVLSCAVPCCSSSVMHSTLLRPS